MFALIRYASLLAYWTMVRIIAAAPLIQQQPSWFNQYTLADLASDTSYQQSKTTYFSHISVKKNRIKNFTITKIGYHDQGDRSYLREFLFIIKCISYWKICIKWETFAKWLCMVYSKGSDIIYVLERAGDF